MLVDGWLFERCVQIKEQRKKVGKKKILFDFVVCVAFMQMSSIDNRQILICRYLVVAVTYLEVGQNHISLVLFVKFRRKSKFLYK